MNTSLSLIIMFVVIYTFIFGFFMVGLNLQPSSKQVDDLIDCIDNFCKEKGLNSRIEKASENDVYIAYPKNINCYTIEGEKKEFYPERGIYDYCGIILKPDFWNYINIFYWIL